MSRRLTPEQLTWLRKRAAQDCHLYFRLTNAMTSGMRSHGLHRVSVATGKVYDALVKLGWDVNSAEPETWGEADWRGDGI